MTIPIRSDAAWVNTLPLIDVAARELCVICGHAIEQVTACIVAGCDFYNKSHQHCKDDCLCTRAGCMPPRNDVVSLPRGFL